MNEEGRPFMVMTDASNVTTEAVLMQNAGGSLQPVEYILQRFNEAETRYCTYDKEMLGVIHALRN